KTDGKQRRRQIRQTIYLSRQNQTAALRGLDHDKTWQYTPDPTIKLGDLITAGTVIGTVTESELLTTRIMVPPKVFGKVKWICLPGKYTVTDTIMQLQTVIL